MAQSDRWDARRYDESFAFVSALGEELVRLLDAQPGERVLDLGCGTGVLAAAIAACGAEVVGVDRDAAMIEAARTQFPDLEFQQGDAEALALAGPFDAVFSNAALHWMMRPEAVLEGVRAVLRPGGRLVAELGGRGNIAAIEGALREALAAEGLPRDRQQQIWFFPSIAQYATLLERHELEPRLMALFDRPTALEGGAGGMAAWLRMFARRWLAELPPERAEAVVARVEASTRGALWRDREWLADYRRLRVVAVRSVAP